MSKAFTKEEEGQEEAEDDVEVVPAGQKNYMTPQGFAALQAEHRVLLHEERPKVVEIVSWAAGNGDRSENGDYIYGKKRLREIDRRLRYLSKRIESATVVDPEQQKALKQIFFGATVTYIREDGSKKTVTLVGADEADMAKGKISWLSPVARALLKAKKGDEVEVRTPSGGETLEIVEIKYGK
jgi:transcription elongation factor GreB